MGRINELEGAELNSQRKNIKDSEVKRGFQQGVHTSATNPSADMQKF